jgi:O-antigen/teichoic acid export membrane protein
MRTTSRILINVLSSYGALGFAIVLNIFLIPFVISYLGKELFGLVALAQSLQILVRLVGSGMSQAMGRYFVLSYTKEDAGGLQSYYSNAVAITLGILTPVVALLTLAIIFAVPIFNIPPGQTSAFIWMLILLSGFSFIQIWAAPYMAICSAVQKIYLQNICLIVSQIVCVVLLVGLLPTRPTLVTYGEAYLAGAVIRLTLLYIISKRIFLYCRFRFGMVSFRKILAIFSVSSQALLPAVSSSVYMQVNQIIVNYFLGAVYNTYLAVCLIWQNLMWQVMNAVGLAIAPQITTYQAKENWDLVGKAFCRVTKYSALISFPLSAVLAILAGPIFYVWLGEGYETSIGIMPWFALTLALLACQIPPALMLVALGKYRFPSVLAPVFAGVNLTAVLILVGHYKFGLGAIAIVMFICTFVRLGPIQTWYIAKQCRVSLESYLLNGYMKPLLCLVPGVILLLIGREYVSNWSLPGLIIIVVFFLLVYLPGCWLIAFDTWDKNLVKSYLISMRSKLTRQR